MTDLQALAELVTTPIVLVWNAIGSDLLEAAQYGGEEMTNADVIGSCIESHHLNTYGGPDGSVASMLIGEAITKHSWSEVVQALSDSIRLN